MRVNPNPKPKPNPNPNPNLTLTLTLTRTLTFLRRDAREIHRCLQRGESVWVHCAQGFNRGPSGLLAYLLLYTDASWDQACGLDLPLPLPLPLPEA